jgi:hypothetical protein
VRQLSQPVPVVYCPGATQEHIHNENQRLEEEQQFWAKEIVVRIEYKFCPNLTIIDTPGGGVHGWLAA